MRKTRVWARLLGLQRVVVEEPGEAPLAPVDTSPAIDVVAAVMNTQANWYQ